MDYKEALAKGLIEIIGKDVDEAYIKEVENVVHMDQKSDRDRIHTSTRCTGNIPVRRVLADMGFDKVYVVPEQEKAGRQLPDSRIP